MKKYLWLLLLVILFGIKANTQVVSTSYTGFINLRDLAFDNNNNLYVLASNQVFKITPSGIKTLFVSDFAIRGLTFDNFNNLYFANYGNGNITKVTPTGATSIYATGFNLPVSLAFNPSGELFVTEFGNHAVCKVVAGVRQLFATISSARASGLQFDAVGNAYVCGQFAPGVFKITPSGLITTITTFPTYYSQWLSRLPNGDLYIGSSDPFLYLIKVNGSVSQFAGTGSVGNADGPVLNATFNNNTGIAADNNGNLFLCDLNTGNIRKITMPLAASSIFNPDLWLKADAGVNLSGSTVTSWNDQSGFDRHAAATGNIQLLPNAQNGKPVIHFVGGAMGFTTPSFPTFPAKRGTVFVVSKTNGPGYASGGGYGTLVSTYPGSGTTWQFGATTTSYGFYDGVGSSNAGIGSTIPTDFGLVTLLRDDNTSLKFSRNGNPNSTLTIADNQPGINPLKIGWNGGSEVLNGDIAEIIIYGRALSAAEILSVNQYLAGKYNFSLASTTPAISLSNNSINYGNLGLGYSLLDSAIVTNTGSAPLNISGIVSSNAVYEIVYSRNNLLPGDTTHLIIKYNPAAAGSSAATIAITHNATGSPTVINVNGNGISTGYTYQVNQIPGFTGNLYGATWFSNQIGFVSGANGKLYKTTDGGATWTILPFAGTTTLYSIRCIGSELWLFGSNGHICVSHDGGLTFSSFATGTTNVFYDGYFVNGYYGFAVGSNGTICRYNGTVWQPYSLPLTNNFYGVYAYGRSAWAVGSAGIVCRYNYNTDSWSPINPGVPNDLYGVGFWNDNIGYIVGSGGLIYRTVNGGTNWIPCNSGVNVNIRSIRCFSANVAWASCENGNVLQTTDGGNTWVRLPLGGFNFQRIDFNGCQGIAICHNGAVVTFQTNLCNSSYNTTRYVRRGTGTSYGYNSAWYSTKLNGGIAGRYGTVLITTNGGLSWGSTNPYTTENINCIKIFGTTSFIAGSGGYIARCNNLGTNWVRFPGIPANITFHSIAFYPNGTGWAVGSGGTICYYNGSGWVAYNLGGIQNTFRCVYVIGNIAYAVGDNGIICKYNGSAWIDVSPGVSNNFYGCAFVTPLIGYAVGSGGIICKTIDGGQTWFPITSPTTEDHLCVEVGCTLEAMVAGKNGEAFQTTDGGNSWTDYSLDRAVDINSITLIDGEGLLAAEDGEVYAFQFGTGKVIAELTTGGPLTFCEGGSVILTASGGSNYLWSNDAITTSITVTDGGTYSVAVSNAAGCSDTKQVEVVENANPVIDFNLQSSICSNAAALTLSASPAGGIFSGGGVSSGSFNPYLAGTGNKQITYAYTNENGCSNSLTKNIIVNAAPVADAGADKIVYYGYAPQACAALNGSASSGTPAYNFSWSNGSQSAAINVCPVATAGYTLTVTDINQCTSSDVAVVNVIDVRCGPKNNMVKLCHVEANIPVNICVDEHAVPTHLAHGDYFGVCINNQARGAAPTSPSTNGTNKEHSLVFPNPAKNIAFFNISNTIASFTSIDLVDTKGAVIKHISYGKLGKGINLLQINVANLVNGMYLIRIQNGKTIETRMLVVRH